MHIALNVLTHAASSTTVAGNIIYNCFHNLPCPCVCLWTDYWYHNSITTVQDAFMQFPRGVVEI